MSSNIYQAHVFSNDLPCGQTPLYRGRELTERQNTRDTFDYDRSIHVAVYAEVRLR